MTVAKLHRLLGKLIEQGHGRKPVNVDKPTFTHPLEDDGCVLLHVNRVAIQVVPNIDGDGGTKMNKDGTESMMTLCVLSGSGVRCECGIVDCMNHLGAN